MTSWSTTDYPWKVGDVSRTTDGGVFITTDTGSGKTDTNVLLAVAGLESSQVDAERVARQVVLEHNALLGRDPSALGELEDAVTAYVDPDLKPEDYLAAHARLRVALARFRPEIGDATAPKA